MDGFVNCLVDSMCRYVGQTVTVFTNSGGLSGSGFTGVLVSCDCNCIRLLCDVGAAPACPIGSSCAGFGNFGNSGLGFGLPAYSNNSCCGINPLGSIAIIPTCAIVCFTHNAI